MAAVAGAVRGPSNRSDSSVATVYRWRHQDLHGRFHQPCRELSAHRFHGTMGKWMDAVESSCESQLSDQEE